MPLDAGVLAKAIGGDMPDLIALYRDLHANPELSMQEVRTPALLAPQMRELGFEVTEGVGETGVVSVMRNGAGPVLMLRADMDGLPVVEQTDLPYASKVRAKARSGVRELRHARIRGRPRPRADKDTSRRQAATDESPLRLWTIKRLRSHDRRESCLACGHVTALRPPRTAETRRGAGGYSCE